MIDGIEIMLEARRYSEGGSIDVELSWDDGASWTSTGYGTGDLPYSDTNYYLGGASDNWGHDWTASEINDHFRVRVTAHHTGGASPYVYLDWIPVTVYYTPPLPDLIITDKHETWVGTNNNFTVSYEVKNQGSGAAVESKATLYVDGIDVEHQATPALDPDESSGELTFDYEVSCPCDNTVNITACADNDKEVTESEENNNCKKQDVICPVCPKPDLVITDKHENWVGNNFTVLQGNEPGSLPCRCKRGNALR